MDYFGWRKIKLRILATGGFERCLLATVIMQSPSRGAKKSRLAKGGFLAVR
jgi:hypothetical protein